MFQQLFNWRTLLALIAILIVSGTIAYSSYIARKIEREERQNIEEWVAASQALLNPQNSETNLPFKIIQDNTEIPIIVTNERDSILEYINLDTAKANKEATYLTGKLKELKSGNAPVVWTDPLNAGRANRYYFGNSALLQEVRFYPLVQLFIVALFIVITITALRTSYRSTQNQVWAGMAKETAHQLGTPVSSLEGWVEILKESHAGESFVGEIEKDVTRLRLVTDRFGKIGSTPQLEEKDVIEQIRQMVDYMRKRASGKVQFHLDDGGAAAIPARISAPLFDWVIENLLKNALDAMEGKGDIRIQIAQAPSTVVIDVSDSGKGISRQNQAQVFNPGFTTKKRGWGLGLSLSKRIIEQYHRGTIGIKQSEPGKGTTFRIVLNK